MRKTILSTLALATIVAAIFTQPLVAQQFRPNQSGQQLKEPPRFLPPANSAKPIQRVGYQQEDVAVPSILGGQTAPAAKPVQATQQLATQQLAPQQLAPQRPMQKPVTAAPRTANLPSNIPPLPKMANGTHSGNAMQPTALTSSQTAPPTSAPSRMMAPSRTIAPGRTATPNRAAVPKIVAKSAATQPAIQPGSQVNSLAGSPNWLRNSKSQQEQEEQSQRPATQKQQQLESPATSNNAARQIQTPLVSSTTTTTLQPSTGAAGLNSTAGPKLRVISKGPASISIGKSAKFEVIVENLDMRSAESVIVGIDIPEWVDLNSSNMSTGTREVTAETGESRLVWQIPIVEASTSEKVVLDLIPREARPFDLDVEWTFKPIRGKTTVEVTQPKLSIQIAGPTEVQFGEKALYNVTVSNPGTGTAENVSVMLPEALGGERASLDAIAPQQQKKFQVELIARSAGTLDLTTTVLADGNLKESDTREIVVRRGVLNVVLDGPGMKYAGSIATYSLTVSNEGDAMARDVIAAVALPPGVEFVSGIDNVEKIDGGIRWNVGMLSPGNQRTYKINCNISSAGDVIVEAASRGAGDLAATTKFTTKVETVVDLVLTVSDPKGPLPTGEEIEYQIKIVNRGTKSASSVNVVMHFSEGVEPQQADGIANEIGVGEVKFAPIAQIDPGQEVTLKVRAIANKAGSHRFRAQLLCEAADLHEVDEGTTRFYGESTGGSTEETPKATTTATSDEATIDGGAFKR